MNCYLNNKNVAENKVEESVYYGLGSDYIQGFLTNIVIDEALFSVCSNITDTKELLVVLFCISFDIVTNGIDVEDLKAGFDYQFDTYGSISDFASNLTLEVFQYVKSEFTAFSNDVSDYEYMLNDFRNEYGEIADKLVETLKINNVT